MINNVLIRSEFHMQNYAHPLLGSMMQVVIQIDLHHPDGSSKSKAVDFYKWA